MAGVFSEHWELPRSRFLRRQCLLHPFFRSLSQGSTYWDAFVQHSGPLLKILDARLGSVSEPLAAAQARLREEAALLPCDGASASDSLSSHRTGAAADLLLGIRLRLYHWIAGAVLAAYPEAAKLRGPGEWLALCASDAFGASSAQLSALLDSQRNAELDILHQMLQHERAQLDQICGSRLDPPRPDPLLQAAGLMPPRVLIIAGSDSGGGAGLQADLKSCTALGAFGTTAVTALTAQNSRGVQGILPISIDFLKQQLESVLSDLGTDVVKTGMLATADIVKAVASSLQELAPGKMLVVDPVMVSTSGHTLLQEDAIQCVKEQLFPLATLITPNLPEASLLLGRSISSVPEMEQAVRDLAAMGPRWVLLKGGHLKEGAEEAIDILCDGQESIAFKSAMIPTTHSHGTGCTLASSIAALLARGLEVPEAVQEAKDFVSGAIACSAKLALGSGPQGPMNHCWRHFDW